MKKIILPIIIFLIVAGIGFGGYYFNKYYAVQKRSVVESQIDKMTAENDELKKQVNYFKTLNGDLRSTNAELEDKISELEENPEVITQTIEKPVYISQPQVTTPKRSACKWIGNFYYCDYY